MKSLRCAAALGAIIMAASPASAAEKTLYMRPVPLDASSELVFAVHNICKTQAAYSIAVKEGLTGAALKRRKGTIAPGRGATFVFTPEVGDEVLVSVVKLSCASQTSTDKRIPLLGIVVRDVETKVPRFDVDASMDGNDW